MKKRKPSKSTGNVRVTKKTNVAMREQNNIVDRANHWLGIVTLVAKCYWLLESLPWDKLHHLIT
ncbi:TPA: hypothetical protein ACV4T7_004519 [Burkholderia ambifaria]